MVGGRLSVHRLFRSPFLEFAYSWGIVSIDGSAFKVEGSLPDLSNRAYRVAVGSSL